MKNSYFILSLILVSVALASCRSTESETLQKAERVLDEHPDSALKILSTIRYPEELVASELAHYGLLLTQATDKNYKEVASDSLISIAVEYYNKSPELEKRALANFYKGRYFLEKQQHTEATLYFKEAERVAEELKYYDLLVKVYNNLGLLNRREHLYDLALFYYKKAYQYAVMLNNNYRIAINAQGMAKSFYLSGQEDSAYFYFNKSAEISVGLDSISQAWLLHNVGTFYSDIEQPDTALYYLHRSLNLEKQEKEKYRTYVVLAEAYTQKQDTAQANFYWTQSLQTEDPALKNVIHYNLYKKSLRERDFSGVSLYVNKYIGYRDSVYRCETRKKIAEIQTKYDNETLLNKNLQSENRIIYLTASLLFVLLLLIGSILFSRNKTRKQKEKAQLLIAAKENELKDFQKKLHEIEGYIEYEGNIKSVLLAEKQNLKETIAKKEEELKRYRDIKQPAIKENKEIEFHESALRGVKLFSEIVNSERKTKALTSADFVDIINYYHSKDIFFHSFITSKEYQLSNLEIVICILFRSNQSHPKVAACLGSTSSTLTKAKSRIKNKIAEPEDKRKLEEILLEKVFL